MLIAPDDIGKRSTVVFKRPVVYVGRINVRKSEAPTPAEITGAFKCKINGHIYQGASQRCKAMDLSRHPALKR